MLEEEGSAVGSSGVGGVPKEERKKRRGTERISLHVLYFLGVNLLEKIRDLFNPNNELKNEIYILCIFYLIIQR